MRVSTCATCSCARLDRRRDRGSSARPPRSRAATRTRWCAACASCVGGQRAGRRRTDSARDRRSLGRLARGKPRPRGRRLAGVMEEAHRKGRPSLRGRRDRALRFGWIDSKGSAFDDDRSMLWFSPRRRAAPGQAEQEADRAARREHRMAPAGAQMVESAKADSSWSRLDEVENLLVPGDLAAAFEGPGSREQWDGFPPSARRAILEWIVQAKRGPRGPAGGGDRPAGRRASGRTNGGQRRRCPRARLVTCGPIWPLSHHGRARASRNRRRPG